MRRISPQLERNREKRQEDLCNGNRLCIVKLLTASRRSLPKWLEHGRLNCLIRDEFYRSVIPRLEGPVSSHFSGLLFSAWGLSLPGCVICLDASPCVATFKGRVEREVEERFSFCIFLFQQEGKYLSEASRRLPFGSLARFDFSDFMCLHVNPPWQRATGLS